MVKDPVPLGDVRRALIIKLRHHGDVLLAAPVFSVLKAHAPHIAIDALVYADTAAMLTLHPAIDHVHTIDRQWKKLGPLAQAQAEWQLLQTLRGQHYDLVIHLTEHPRGAWLARLTGAHWAVAPEVRGRGRFWRSAFTHFVGAPRNALRHTVERNLDALRRIGVYPSPAERCVSLVPGGDAEARVAALLAAHGIAATTATDSDHGFVLVHPASRWHFKCWPAAKMAALINALHAAGQRVVLSAAPDAAERAMIEAIQAQLPSPAISLAGQLSLKELAALAARAKLFIGVDSAPMHIAAAMGTPCVALFGPSGDREWGPWQAPADDAPDSSATPRRHRIVSSDTHPCRPCGIDGCGGSKESDCLAALPVARVRAAVTELLGV
ncbi:putative lipopolysaccharide heptosyltransferase III [Rhodocyclus tenuis]|uniref:Lipopolysaccharide heptosyltransferase III n=1 Tax=Rhodocyclus gracilis TaxID=2929842 RepID=A0ABX0WL11_9RHOO|nr:putative lipopolysaccharide heptosyltransferase III [Rhodocyclus gracilis]MRD74001.1 putative lipopolysaccharide heptosyltransferase III [Rhodocyclus gracilis]NJA89991.1 putative lipopolysaccharide heptosyltransferase III [Rhodocyclus gracilis]